MWYRVPRAERGTDSIWTESDAVGRDRMKRWTTNAVCAPVQLRLSRLPAHLRFIVDSLIIWMNSQRFHHQASDIA